MKTRLPSGKSAGELLDMYFLDARMHLLETAAILDRIERAVGGKKTMSDPRVRKLLAGTRILGDGRAERAERYLKLLSVDGGNRHENH